MISKELYQVAEEDTERGNDVYINEVIRACDTLCPNEYSEDEKYRWCDELSAMLTQEHLKKYNKITVEPEEDNSYLLPEGVTFEMVDRILDGAREIDKRDFRSCGIEYYYGLRGRFVFPIRNRVRGKIDVIYIVKHNPIRNISINNTVKFKHNGFYTDNPKFIKGDTVTITTDNVSFENIAILDIQYPDEKFCFIVVPDETFRSLFSGGETEKKIQCEIKRIVTEKTVCDSPYDRMYVDYVNAQICYYQRDFDTYNQHMNLFNQRLAAYQSWLQERRAQDRDGKITNWW